jgi:RimJ/RimL family protein N-acetyltransferase
VIDNLTFDSGLLIASHMNMDPADFVAFHRPALETDEIRYNVILAILGRVVEDEPADVLLWTLGGPGACAVKTPGRPILLGNMTEAQCRKLAEDTTELDHPGVIGPDLTAKWFVARARELGLEFAEPIVQQLHALTDRPRYPQTSGHARAVTTEDAALFADWLTAFVREATPHDPVPVRDQLERTAGEGRYLFWIDDGRPVSMAGIVRRLRTCAAIAGVYTPPALRGRGYAGSVTAAVVERVYAEGRMAACLYTDLSNPFSNRCYAKIGFKPVCQSLLFHRRTRTP